MMNCNNCNNPVSENYCSNCGQAAKLKRIDNHYIIHEISHLLHFEKGFFYTAKELITRPGDSIREFIAENRNKHVKPVAYLIFTSLLFTVVSHFFHADEIYNSREKIMLGKSSVGNLLNWIQTHYGYANIIMGAFIALGVQLLFKKYKYSFFEIIVLLCFVMGQGMLLLTIQALFLKLLSMGAYKVIVAAISFAYPTWAIGQFFDKAKIASYIKAFVAYLVGYILFYVSLTLFGVAADIIIKTFLKH